MASVPLVDALGTADLGSGVGAIVLLASIGFGLPATTLSAVAPMVVRATIVDVATSGSLVGRLSAAGTLGAITGTFLTGFYLLGTFPTRAIILATGALLVLVGLSLVWWARSRGRDAQAGRRAGSGDHPGRGAGRTGRRRRGDPRDTEPMRARERLLLHPGRGGRRQSVGPHADARPAAPCIRGPRRPELPRIRLHPLVRLRGPRHRRGAKRRLRRRAPGWRRLHVPAPSRGGVPGEQAHHPRARPDRPPDGDRRARARAVARAEHRDRRCAAVGRTAGR